MTTGSLFLVGLLGLAIFAIVALVAFNSTPIADDYTTFVAIPAQSPWSWLHNYWMTLTDRYSNALLMEFTVKLLGQTAIHVTPVLLLALMAWFLTIAARNVGVIEGRRGAAVAVGLVSTVAVAMSAPSVFDSLGWFNAVAIYLAGIVAAAGVLGWGSHLLGSAARHVRLRPAASFAIAFVATGFTEVVGVMIVLSSLLAIANVAGAVAHGPRRRSLLHNFVALAAGSGVGVIVIFAGPGSQLRAHLQHSSFMASRLLDAVRDNVVWLHVSLVSEVMPATAAAFLCLYVLRPPANRNTASWLIVWAGFLLVLPLLVVSAMVGYAGGPVSYRAAFVVTAAITAGIGLLVYVAGRLTLGDRSPTWLLPCAVVALAVAALHFEQTVAPAISAERVRQSAVDARAVSIREQLQEHPRVVSVMPVPLIDPTTEAYDLMFGPHRQLGYVLGEIRTYYGIPPDVRVRVIKAQPPRECLPTVSVPWLGARSCTQLADG